MAYALFDDTGRCIAQQTKETEGFESHRFDVGTDIQKVDGEIVIVTDEEREARDSAVLIADAAAENRASRDRLLADSDWVVTKSVEAGVAVPIEWATYRQALRDVPQQEGFPQNVIWPTKPTE